MFIFQNPDLNYLTLIGYNIAPGSSLMANTSAERVIGVYSNLTGEVSTDIVIPTAFAGQNVYDTVATSSVSGLYVATSNGLFYVQGVPNPNVEHLISSTPVTRVRIYSGDLYVATTSNDIAVISGLPTSGTQSLQTLFNIGAPITEFFLFDVLPGEPGYDLAYVSVNNTYPPGIQKWRKISNTWTQMGSQFGIAFVPRGMTGHLTAGNAAAVLYLTTDKLWIRLQDNAPESINTNWWMSDVIVCIRSSVVVQEDSFNLNFESTVFWRGIDFGPGGFTGTGTCGACHSAGTTGTTGLVGTTSLASTAAVSSASTDSSASTATDSTAGSTASSASSAVSTASTALSASSTGTSTTGAAQQQSNCLSSDPHLFVVRIETQNPNGMSYWLALHYCQWCAVVVLIVLLSSTTER